MFGRRIPWWMYIIMFTTTITVVFTVFEVAPYVHNSWFYKLVGFSMTFFGISTVYTVLRVVFRDPGYLPLPSSTERLDKLMKNTAARTYFMECSTEIGMIESDELGVDMYFCPKCKVSRPKRTVHCTICKECVERMDHHCTWFGTCIGRRNYGSFYLFLFHANALTFIGGSVSLTNFISVWVKGGFVLAISSSPTFFLIMSAMILPPLGLCALVALLYIHTRSIAMDVTTFETNRGWKGSFLGFSRRDKMLSIMRNFKTIVFATSPPSQLNPDEVEKRLAIRRNSQKSCCSEHNTAISLDCPFNNESFEIGKDACTLSCDNDNTFFTTWMRNIAAKYSCGPMLDPYSIPPTFFSSKLNLDKDIMESTNNLDMENSCGLQKC